MYTQVQVASITDNITDITALIHPVPYRWYTYKIQSTYITLGIETEIMPSGKRSWPASLASPGAAGPAGPVVAAAAAPAPDPKIINRIIILRFIIHF